MIAQIRPLGRRESWLCRGAASSPAACASTPSMFLSPTADEVDDDAPSFIGTIIDEGAIFKASQSITHLVPSALLSSRVIRDPRSPSAACRTLLRVFHLWISSSWEILLPRPRPPYDAPLRRDSSINRGVHRCRGRGTHHSQRRMPRRRRTDRDQT